MFYGFFVFREKEQEKELAEQVKSLQNRINISVTSTITPHLKFYASPL
jgi:hypothetical protein